MYRIPFMLLLLVLLQACASPAEPWPKALLDAEQNMQRGTAAYHNDEYNLAANSFTNALDLYQSIDDAEGVFEASLNLMQTSITIGNTGAARQTLQRMRGPAGPALAERDRIRLKLLEVRLLHREGDLREALEMLHPLWPSFDEQQRISGSGEFDLAVVAATARLMQSLNHPDAALWLSRLQQAVTQGGSDQSRYSALLLRLRAHDEISRQRYPEARRLLEQALAIYRQQLHRRGIAVTLQRMAEVSLKQGDVNTAEGLFQRSLRIHLWTLNQQAAIEVLEHLVEINRELGDGTDLEVFGNQLEQLGRP